MSPDHPGGQNNNMQCHHCGLTLDPRQVAQTGHCPRCGIPVTLAQQGFAPPQSRSQQPYGAPPGFTDTGQPSYSGPPPQPYGAPPPGGFGTPPMTPGFSVGPMAPRPLIIKPNPMPILRLAGVVAAVALCCGIGLFVGLLQGTKTVGSSGDATATARARQEGQPTATPSPRQTTSTAVGFQPFTSPDHAFRIAYPGSWQESAAPSGTGTQFSSASGQTFMVADHESLGNVTVADLDSASCQTSSIGGTPTSPVLVTIGAQSWTQEECDNSDGTLHAVAEAIIYKGAAFLIVYGSSQATFASDKAQFYQPMEQSFQFLA